MTIDEFKLLKQKADKDVKMPDTFEAIMTKNNLLPALVQDWTKLYNNQKFVYSHLNIELMEIYGDIYKCYKFSRQTTDLQAKYGITVNQIWDNTKGIETQINCTPAYIAKMKEVNQQKYIMEFIESTLENIKNLAYTIKNYIEYKKILSATF
jgi:hypothetical protein